MECINIISTPYILDFLFRLGLYFLLTADNDVTFIAEKVFLEGVKGKSKSFPVFN
jgi:hypothetical protein